MYYFNLNKMYYDFLTDIKNDIFLVNNACKTSFYWNNKDEDINEIINNKEKVLQLIQCKYKLFTDDKSYRKIFNGISLDNVEHLKCLRKLGFDCGKKIKFSIGNDKKKEVSVMEFIKTNNRKLKRYMYNIIKD